MVAWKHRTKLHCNMKLLFFTEVQCMLLDCGYIYGTTPPTVGYQMILHYSTTAVLWTCDWYNMQYIFLLLSPFVHLSFTKSHMSSVLLPIHFGHEISIFPYSPYSPSRQLWCFSFPVSPSSLSPSLFHTLSFFTSSLSPWLPCSEFPQ